MILNLEKIYKEITERLTHFETAEAISGALDTVVKVLNNPFLSEIYEMNVEKEFSTVTLANPQGEDMDYLAVNIDSEDIFKGMAVSIYGTGYLDGIYLVKQIQDGKVVFESESILGDKAVSKNIKWYVLNLPKQADDNFIANVIEIKRIHMPDIAGLSQISQGTDSKSFKQGSPLTHFITKTLQGYFYQPNSIWKGWISS